MRSSEQCSFLAWMGSTSQVILWSILVSFTYHLLHYWFTAVKYDIHRHCAEYALHIYCGSVSDSFSTNLRCC